MSNVTVTNLVLNALLSGGKLAAGLVFHSAALLADAADNASDMFQSVLTLAALKMSGKDADADHPYGHERLEPLMSLILSAILAVVGIGVLADAIKIMLTEISGTLEAPSALAMAVAGISIVVKFAMYFTTMGEAKKRDSIILRANALNYRADIVSNAAVFAAIALAQLGLTWADPLMGVLISLLILKSAVDIFRSASKAMTDHAADPKLQAEIAVAIKTCPGVLRLDDLKTRVFNARVYADIEISANGNQTLYEAHQIADNLHNLLEREFPKIKHCTIHVNPR
ncbi:MAG: cation diffusion facilitator family transporter [Oscillospiraceae bacterium]|nr:cation diffusion facilitator family transporter [Oscillospiraceae bacterium]